MGWIDQEEDTLIGIYGKENVKKDADTSHLFIFEMGKPYVCVLRDVKDSDTYKKVFIADVEGVDKPVVIRGNRVLIKKLGYDENPIVQPVKTGDKFQLVFTGMYKTKSGGRGYDFTINYKFY